MEEKNIFIGLLRRLKERKETLESCNHFGWLTVLSFQNLFYFLTYNISAANAEHYIIMKKLGIKCIQIGSKSHSPTCNVEFS